MIYFGKLSEDERMQELVYDEYRRKMDYRLDQQDSKEEGRQEGIQEGIEQGLKRGMQRGRQEGRKEGMQEIVLNMLKENWILIKKSQSKN